MKRIFAAAAFGLMLAGQSFAPALADDCTRPPAPSVPKGAEANNDEMVAAHHAVTAYMADTQGYLDCLQNLENRHKEAETLTPELQQEYLTRYNAAVDSMETVAAEFNQAVRDYKAANPQ
jgi:hypothetical protein